MAMTNRSLKVGGSREDSDLEQVGSVVLPNQVLETRSFFNTSPEGRELPLAKKSAIMDQKNRMFVPHVLPVQTGTSVRFPNSDDIRHQVYSFSSAKQFQIPLYKGTPANPVVFDRAGVVSLGCSIHDRMTAYVVVVDTPYFATTDRKGRGAISSVGAGKYSLRVWYPDMTTEPAPVPLTLAASDNQELVVTVRK